MRTRVCPALKGGTVIKSLAPKGNMRAAENTSSQEMLSAVEQEVYNRYAHTHTTLVSQAIQVLTIVTNSIEPSTLTWLATHDNRISTNYPSYSTYYTQATQHTPCTTLINSTTNTVIRYNMLKGWAGLSQQC